MRLYLDCCCYNRPFDDLRQGRIRVESEAVLSILEQAEIGVVELLASPALAFEISAISDQSRRDKVLGLYSLAKVEAFLTPTALDLAKHFQKKSGMEAMDALHLAIAMECEAEALLTVDGGFRKKASKMPLKYIIENPVFWLDPPEFPSTLP